MHEIGKFGQRADITYTEATLLDTNTKNIIGSICKLTREGWYSHQHVLWTKAFIDKHIVKFNKAGLAENNDTYNNLVNLASYHHVLSTNEQGLITLADWWISGIDRNTDKALEKNASWGKDKFRSMPLASVFEKLDKWGQGDAKAKWVYPGSAADYQYISLFEHLKTTGAFAHCFAAYIQEQPDCYKSDSNHRLAFKENIYPVQLLCGDVSGI